MTTRRTNAPPPGLSAARGVISGVPTKAGIFHTKFGRFLIEFNIAPKNTKESKKRMKLRPNTQNAGADLERQAVMRKVKAIYRDVQQSTEFSFAAGQIRELIVRLEGRAARNQRRPGGLGRKPKKAAQ